MRRAPLVGVLVAMAGTASAGRKVDIDSDPPGAAVYFNDIDSGTVCAATPCTVDAPFGATAVILRKDGYAPGFEQIDVPRKGKLKPFKFTLQSATATLIVDDPLLKGGTIKVDDISKGTAPQRVDVNAESHHIVVVVKGKPLYDEFVEVEPGQEVVVRAKASAASAQLTVGTTGTTRTEDGSDDGEGSGSDEGTPKIKKTGPEPARDRFINVGVAVDIGFRQFKYENPQNLPATENEAGQALVGPALELWPVELLGGDHLRGLSLFGKVTFGINQQKVLDEMNQDVGVSTLWGNIEADLRHTWRFANNGIELGAGFVRDQMDYNGTATDRAKVPVVDYKSIRIGVRGATKLGIVEPFAGIEGRIVLSAGDLQRRFTATPGDKADVTGGRAVVGATARFGPLFARVEGSIVYYSWTIVVNSQMPQTPRAQGATDMVEWIGINLGLVH